MNHYPATEQRISEIERGRSSTATLPLTPGQTLAVGDTILFELVRSRAGQASSYVKGGDSLRVLLTEAADLGETDAETGHALFRVAWSPLGQSETPEAAPKRASRPRSSRGPLLA